MKITIVVCIVSAICFLELDATKNRKIKFDLEFLRELKTKLRKLQIIKTNKEATKQDADDLDLSADINQVANIDDSLSIKADDQVHAPKTVKSVEIMLYSDLYQQECDPLTYINNLYAGLNSLAGDPAKQQKELERLNEILAVDEDYLKSKKCFQQRELPEMLWYNQCYNESFASCQTRVIGQGFSDYLTNLRDPSKYPLITNPPPVVERALKIATSMDAIKNNLLDALALELLLEAGYGLSFTLAEGMIGVAQNNGCHRLVLYLLNQGNFTAKHFSYNLNPNLYQPYVISVVRSVHPSVYLTTHTFSMQDVPSAVLAGLDFKSEGGKIIIRLPSAKDSLSVNRGMRSIRSIPNHPAFIKFLARMLARMMLKLDFKDSVDMEGFNIYTNNDHAIIKTIIACINSHYSLRVLPIPAIKVVKDK